MAIPIVALTEADKHIDLKSLSVIAVAACAACMAIVPRKFRRRAHTQICSKCFQSCFTFTEYAAQTIWFLCDVCADMHGSLDGDLTTKVYILALILMVVNDA